jgi:hypothetical protein
MRRALYPLVALALAACGETVDTAGLPSVDGYSDWHRIDVTGPAPGHGDTYRIIYVNEVGRGYAHAGQYPAGTVIVKEIHALTGAGEAGDLDYIAIMRKIPDDAPEATGLPLDDDWLFTYASEPGGDETRYDFCWAKCHVQGPVDGAWFDYGR